MRWTGCACRCRKSKSDTPSPRPCGAAGFSQGLAVCAPASLLLGDRLGPSPAAPHPPHQLHPHRAARWPQTRREVPAQGDLQDSQDYHLHPAVIGAHRPPLIACGQRQSTANGDHRLVGNGRTGGQSNSAFLYLASIVFAASAITKSGQRRLGKNRPQASGKLRPCGSHRPRFFQNRCDLRLDPRRIDGLGKIAIDPGGKVQAAVVGHRIGGHSDHR